MLQISRSSWHYRFIQECPFTDGVQDCKLTDLCTYVRKFFFTLFIWMLFIFIVFPVGSVAFIIMSLIQILCAPIYFIARFLLVGKIAIPKLWNLAVFKFFTNKCDLFDGDGLEWVSSFCLFNYEKKWNKKLECYVESGDAKIDSNIRISKYKIPPIVSLISGIFAGFIATNITKEYWLAFLLGTFIVILMTSIAFLFSKFGPKIKDTVGEKAETIFEKFVEAKHNSICPLIEIIDEVKDEAK